MSQGVSHKYLSVAVAAVVVVVAAAAFATFYWFAFWAFPLNVDIWQSLSSNCQKLSY